MLTFGPLDSEPYQLRPPYTVDPSIWASRPGEPADQWCARRRADRLAALLEPLQGMEVSDYERRILAWLSEWEDSTVTVVAALLHRARAARPLASGGHTPRVGGR